MQHSANYLRAYHEIHTRVRGRVDGMHQASSFKRWPPGGLLSVRFGPTRVGACRRRIDPGYPKPFSDASF